MKYELEQPDETGCRLRVTEAGLSAAKCRRRMLQLAPDEKSSAKGTRLDGIAQGCARTVRFEELQRASIDGRLLHCSAQHPLLRLAIRCGEAR